MKSLVRVFRFWWESLRLQLGALAGMYNLAVLLLVIAHFTVGERWAVVDFANNFMPFWLGGCWVMFFLALFTRYRVLWAGYAVLPMLVSVMWYAPLFIPTPEPVLTPDVVRYRALSYNIQGQYLEMPYQTILDTIRAQSPDFAALQETNPNTVDRLQADLTDWKHIMRGGLALFTPHRVSWDTVQVIAPNNPFTHTMGVRAIVETPHHDVAVYVVHLVRPRTRFAFLGYDSRQRAEGTRLILEAVQAETLPVVLLCDCNMGQQSGVYADFGRILRDVWWERGTGFGLTASTYAPLLRSDYVWVSADFTPISAQVLDTVTVADHFPIVADLGLNP